MSISIPVIIISAIVLLGLSILLAYGASVLTLWPIEKKLRWLTMDIDDMRLFVSYISLFAGIFSLASAIIVLKL